MRGKKGLVQEVGAGGRAESTGGVRHGEKAGQWAAQDMCSEVVHQQVASLCHLHILQLSFAHRAKARQETVRGACHWPQESGVDPRGAVMLSSSLAYLQHGLWADIGPVSFCGEHQTPNLVLRYHWPKH